MFDSRRPIALAVVAALATGSISPRLLAADDDKDKKKALATDLFDKGVKKMEQGHCDEGTITNETACREARESFKRAYELYPDALGALRNLAYVEKGLGLVASASRSFRDLARKAPLDPKPERRMWAEFAKKEVGELEGRIPHLVVKMPSDKPAGAKVTLDGAPLDEAAWGTQIDVDPGKHDLVAEAPGRLKFVGSITLAEKQTKTISISLDPDKGGTPINPETRPASKTLPLVVTAVGVVGVGVGLTFGYLSLRKKDDACGGTKQCDPQGLSDGKSLANVSTIVTSAGAVVLAAGLVWYLVAPNTVAANDKATVVAPYALRDGAGIVAAGRF